MKVITSRLEGWSQLICIGCFLDAQVSLAFKLSVTKEVGESYLFRSFSLSHLALRACLLESSYWLFFHGELLLVGY